MRGLGRKRFRGYRVSGFYPGLDAAVQHMNVLMAEVFQKPQPARGPHAGILLVEDNLFVKNDNTHLEVMIENVHEGLEGCRAGIDKAQAEKIEMDRSGDMALGEFFCRPGVNKNKARSQGEFVLAKNLKSVKDLRRVLDIRPRILYKRFRLHDGGRISLEPQRTPSPSRWAQRRGASSPTDGGASLLGFSAQDRSNPVVRGHL